ncbi:glycosyltransferase family 4 protein [Pseudomonas sp.]|uniref:glycosyltransferase family 4 protein n=1 Tax=Pseudomonas sp. TaxID=306 RepID=UPI002638E48A|nr:glycosyltransferase family 4 protein [Pseudomonas sp.]
MIKVLHFYKTYYPETMGGSEQVIFQIAEGGARHGFESEVLSLSRQGGARDEIVGHHVSHRSKLDFHLASTGFSLSVFKDFAALAKTADVIHYHFPWPLMDVVHFACRIKKPTVVSYHSDIIKQKTLLKLYRPLMDRFLSSVDRIVASSPNYAQSSPVLNKFEAKVRIIPYGLDRGTYPQSSDEKLDYWRQLVGSRFFLFVGALRYYKGLDYLLEAAHATQLPVVILGGGHLEQELKARALQLGLNNVYFLGSLPDEDKAALLELCYAFVFPSHLRSESFGISLLEGAMFGKPMISCEIGTGTTFINIAGETGLVVPPCDAAALGQAMLSLWQNPEMALTMGENAQRRYEEFFSADVMAESYANVYRELLHI